MAINILLPGSQRFLATVLGNYIFFGYFAYKLLRKEFPWFIHQRHEWLKRYNARNYTVLVTQIPDSMRSSLALKQHFDLLYGQGSVVQANMVLHLNDFTAAIEKRKRLVALLEHALAELAIYEKRPTHLMPMGKKVKSPPNSPMSTTINNDNNDNNNENNDISSTFINRNTTIKRAHIKNRGQIIVDSIDYYTAQLNKANQDISQRWEKIQQKSRPKFLKDSLYSKKYANKLPLMMVAGQGSLMAMPSRNLMAAFDDDDDHHHHDHKHAVDDDDSKNSVASTIDLSSNILHMASLDDDSVHSNTSNASNKNKSKNIIKLNSSKGKNLKKTISSTSELVAHEVVNSTQKMKRKLHNQASEYMKVRARDALEFLDKAESVGATVFSSLVREEGKPDSAAFITFSSLVATHSAIQMSQHHEPFVLAVDVAPGKKGGKLRFSFDVRLWKCIHS